MMLGGMSRFLTSGWGRLPNGLVVPGSLALANPLGRFGTTGGSCCGCVYFQDNFTQPDSTDLGLNWEEHGEGDDWEIYGQKLITTANNALCTCIKEAPGETLEYKIDVVVTIPYLNNHARVVFNFVSANTYHFLDLRRGYGDYFYATFYHRVGGVDTALTTEAQFTGDGGSNTVAVRLCLTETKAVAVDNAGHDTIAGGIDTGSSVAGVATGTIGGTVAFDSFKLSTSAPECPTCSVHCLYGSEVMEAMTGEFSDEFGDEKDGWIFNGEHELDTGKLHLYGNATGYINYAFRLAHLPYDMTGFHFSIAAPVAIDFIVNDPWNVYSRGGLMVWPYSDAGAYLWWEKSYKQAGVWPDYFGEYEGLWLGSSGAGGELIEWDEPDALSIDFQREEDGLYTVNFCADAGIVRQWEDVALPWTYGGSFQRCIWVGLMAHAYIGSLESAYFESFDYQSSHD